MTVSLVCEDVLQWAEKTPPIGAHALLADAPYELNFMSREWDRTGIAFRPDTWRALAQHLLPGAFLMCFASSRGWHRLACALEDAGLVMHPSVFMLGWAQGSGWPKSTKIDMAIDKAAGMEREVIEDGPYASRRPHADHNRQGVIHADDAYIRPAGDRQTAPATPLAKAWAGHRYGLQALKPSVEPLLVFQKPYQGAPVDSITATGAGVLNIEGGRLAGLVQAAAGGVGGCSGSVPESQYVRGTGCLYQSSGRWPPNLALLHLPGCEAVGTVRVQGSHDGVAPGGGDDSSFWAGKRRHPYASYAAPDGTETVQAYRCAPGCPVAALDRQAGEWTSGGKNGAGNISIWGGNDTRVGGEMEASSGPASRFFHMSDWSLDVAEQLALADPAFYCPKASQAERSAGLAGRNLHPTIKPLALCAWLATLLLPPAAYAPRRLLVPFSGTGSEIVGGIRAGWEEIIGIEQDPDSVATAERRIAYWTGWQASVQRTEPPATAPVAEKAQLTLW